MRAVVAQRPGRLGEVLAVHDLPDTGDPGPGEVFVRMVAAAVNPSDAVTVSGAYASRTSFPYVPGFEGVGVVERAGPGVPSAMLGRRVLPVGSAGCWAKSKRTEASWCVPVSDDVPDDAASFAYVNPLTAWLMVERFCGGDVRQVAVTAAGSTIAGHLARLLGERGIRPIGLVRAGSRRGNPDSALWREVIGTDDARWPERLQRASGGQLDVVFDCVGGGQGLSLRDRLAHGGVLVHFGLLSGEPLPAECFDGRDGKRVEMFRLRDVVHSHPRSGLPALFAPVFDRLASGLLRTGPVRRVPLTSLPDVLRDDAFRSPTGKILVDCQQ